MTKIDGQIVESEGKSFLLKNGKDGYQIKLSSQQELAVQDTLHDLDIRQKLGGWRSYITLVILLLANLLNYIDRYTIAGMMILSLFTHVTDVYKISVTRQFRPNFKRSILTQ